LTLSASRVQSLLEPYYSGVPIPVCYKILRYMDLLAFWTKKIALTAISDEEEMVRFHFGESIFALSLENFENGRLADVGSGAGFPGLAIKLFCPNLNVILLEPNKKKCAFLSEIVRELSYTDTKVLPIGFEESDIRSNELDYVVSRALGRTEDLLSWSARSLSSQGRVVLWMGSDDVTKAMRTPEWHWRQTSIPQTTRRKILIGTRQPDSR